MATPALVARLTDSQPLITVCAWCPTFDKTDPANKGASHGICPACSKRLQTALLTTDTLEAA